MQHPRLLMPLVVAAWAIFLAAPSLVSSASTLATQGADFAFVNHGSSAIVEVYIADPGATTWGNNIISAPIEPGETNGFLFTPNADQCVYDIHATFENGNPVQLLDWDLCASPVIEFVTQ